MEPAGYFLDTVARNSPGDAKCKLSKLSNDDGGAAENTLDIATVYDQGHFRYSCSSHAPCPS